MAVVQMPRTPSILTVKDLVSYAQTLAEVTGATFSSHSAPLEGFYFNGRNDGISVIWHEGSYSSQMGDESVTVEVWQDGQDDVEGWTPVEFVAGLLRGIA